MSGGGSGAPGGELRAVVRRAIDDLSETAAMALALPGRPPDLPGYTFAAATAIAVAGREEEDTSRWLSAVLISVTTNASILSACVTVDLMAGRDEIAPPLLYQHGSTAGSPPRLSSGVSRSSSGTLGRLRGRGARCERWTVRAA